MALTIRQITDEQIEAAKSETGKGTGSAALVDLIDLAVSRRQLVSALMAENDVLRERLKYSQSVVSRLAASADEVLAIVRQGDLL